MQEYVSLVKKVLREGELRRDRTGVGTKAIFGGMIEFDLTDRFPLVTVKETRWKVAFLEMLWFLRGEDNTDWLHENGSKLWDEWADGRGRLGPIYGVQWRGWETKEQVPTPDKDGHVWHFPRKIDQIAELIEGLKKQPAGRRHIVSAWNVTDLPSMALMPCHWAFQCYVTNDLELDMVVHQRSWDLALGAPFNIAGYALLLTLLGRSTGYKPRKLKFSYGDAHIYTNHLQAMEEVVNRRFYFCDTELKISTDNVDIDGYRLSDFSIENYKHGPFVKLPVAV